MEKKNKPRFNVPNLGFFKSVKARWRKPRGTHNKKRMKFQFMGAIPKIGYRNPPEMRDKHPSGMTEALVNNVNEIDGLKNVVLRISSTVGGRKRKAIEEKARAMGLKVVNLKGDVARKVFSKAKAPKANAPVQQSAKAVKPAAKPKAEKAPAKAQGPKK